MSVIAYIFVKAWVWLSLRLFFHEVKVVGKENIPTDKPVIFIANHFNTLLDPLLIVTSVKKKVWFLTRSDVFNKAAVAKILKFLGAMPVFRMKDGFKAPLKNEVTFSRCRTILGNKGIVALFPEGTHLQHRTLRKFKKGVFRIWEENPDAILVPVGLNFSNLADSKAKVGVCFGKAIAYNKDLNPQDLHQALTTELCLAEQHEEIDRLLDVSWNPQHMNRLTQPQVISAKPWLRLKEILGDYPVQTAPFSFGKYLGNMVLAAACLPLVLVAALSEVLFGILNNLVLRGIKDPQFHIAIKWANKHVWVSSIAVCCVAFWWNAGLFSAWGMLLLLMLLGHLVFPLFKRNVASIMAQIRFVLLPKPQQEAFQEWFQEAVNQ